MSHRNEKRLAPSLKNATTTPPLGLLASQLHYKSGPKALPCRHPQQTDFFFSSHNEVKKFITNVAQWKKCKWRIPQTAPSNTGFFHEGYCLVHECVDVVDMNTETNVWYNLLTYVVSMIIVRSVCYHLSERTTQKRKKKNIETVVGNGTFPSCHKSGSNDRILSRLFSS